MHFKDFWNLIVLILILMLKVNGKLLKNSLTYIYKTLKNKHLKSYKNNYLIKNLTKQHCRH